MLQFVSTQLLTKANPPLKILEKDFPGSLLFISNASIVVPLKVIPYMDIEDV